MLKDERHQFTKIMNIIGQASSLPTENEPAAEEFNPLAELDINRNIS